MVAQIGEEEGSTGERGRLLKEMVPYGQVSIGV